MPEPFAMVTSNKSSKVTKKGMIIGSIVVIFLAISIVAGVFLVQRQQNISEKASTSVSLCPAAEACPVAGEADLLRSCTSISSDSAPQEISCSSISNVGVITTCGTRQFCCPSLGASWTTDISLCSTPSPSPTIAPSLSATASASTTATPSATPKLSTNAPTTLNESATPSATPKATPREIPVTGTNWPTIAGAGVGILVIIGAILLAI